MAKISDVAKLAGVSKGTVSNVFSMKRGVSEAVKERVLSAAETLNYTPNHIARSLTTKQTMIIGLKMPRSHGLNLGEFHANLLNGVVVTAAKKNYRVLIDTLLPKNLDLSYATAEPFDGVIILDPTEDDDRITQLHRRKLPFVVVGSPKSRYVNTDEILSVDNDNENIAFEICQLLIEKGHRNILFLNAPSSQTVANERKKGFFKAFKARNLPHLESFNYYKPNKLEDPIAYGYAATLKFFKEETNIPYTAIIADADRVALGILQALNELGKKIPDDVSLVALSDDLPSTKELGFNLTTVDLRAFNLGVEATQLLFEKMTSKEKVKAHKVIVPAVLNGGESLKTLELTDDTVDR